MLLIGKVATLDRFNVFFFFFHLGFHFIDTSLFALSLHSVIKKESHVTSFVTSAFKVFKQKEIKAANK